MDTKEASYSPPQREARFQLIEGATFKKKRKKKETYKLLHGDERGRLRAGHANDAMLARRNPAIRTMSSNLSTQVGSTLCCSVRCEEREDLSACPLWHRGHIHSAATLLSLLTVSPDSS